jgi:ATP adenylyltransferase
MAMQEILWAPWRMSYVEKPSTGRADSQDIFLDLPAQNEDEKNFILIRGDSAFAVLNAFPYASGHLLVAPYRQVSELTDLDDAELLEIQKMIGKCILAVRKAFNPDGFNIGVNMGRSAGAGIPQHIHWHIVPRWHGDSNFMSVVANTRVLPQSLPDTYRRLKELV